MHLPRSHEWLGGHEAAGCVGTWCEAPPLNVVLGHTQARVVDRRKGKSRSRLALALATRR